MAYLERKIDRFLDEWKKNPARKPLKKSRACISERFMR